MNDTAHTLTGAYALGALRNELRRLAAAQVGARNATLNAAAFALGRFVMRGQLDAECTRFALLNTALAIGLPEPAARATIQSGFSGAIRRAAG